MKRSLLTALLLAASLASAQAPAPAERAKAFFALWKAENFAAMHAELADSWRNKWALDDFKAFFKEPPIKLLRQGGTADTFTGQFYNSSFVYRWEIHYDKAGKIAGMTVTTEGATADYPAKHLSESTPKALRFPFAAGAEWAATGAHHKIARSQSFALDLRIIKDG